MMHSNQALIKDWDQEKISEASILVAGAGAIGSSAAEKLARIRVKKIIVVDFDVLEEHNIENQIYTRKNIGEAKTAALEKIIRDINKEIEFTGYETSLSEAPDEVLDADYYFGCFDNITARLLLNRIAVQNNKPLIDAGIDSFTGTIRTIIPKRTPCYECWEGLLPKIVLKASCAEKIPSTYVTANHASDLMVMQLINLVFGWKAEPYLYFDLKNNICKSFPLRINPECTCCGAGLNGE